MRYELILDYKCVWIAPIPDDYPHCFGRLLGGEVQRLDVASKDKDIVGASIALKSMRQAIKELTDA